VSKLLDHPIISERYFFPQRAELPGACWVESQGLRLGCWRSAPPSEKPVVLHFHGNGELVHHWIDDLTPRIQAMGWELFLAEYRGYGASEGRPVLEGMLDDVPAILEAVGLPPERIVVFGRSIGSIYAIEAIHRVPELAGLVLESGIADLYERLALRMRPNELGCTDAELRAAVKARFDHGAKLAAWSGPSLVMHAEQDHLVGIHHAVRNAESAQDSILVRFPRGDHNSILFANQAGYFRVLGDFLARRTEALKAR
jgi:pimeloyl-ACP methyl ester carboxylesterase